MKTKIVTLLLLLALPLGAAQYAKQAPNSKLNSALLSAVGQPRFRDTLVDMADRYAEIRIPTAQVLTLNDNPLQIVASPGAGNTIVATALYVTMDYNAATYANGGHLELNYGADGSRAIAVDVGLVTAGDDENRYFHDTFGSTTLTDLSGVSNQGLFVQAETAEFITGDSDLYVRVYYRIVPTLLVK